MPSVVLTIYHVIIIIIDAIAVPSARYGRGVGDILMDEVACTGSETRLIDCSHSSNHDCSHFEDASVQCNTS